MADAVRIREIFHTLKKGLGAGHHTGIGDEGGCATSRAPSSRFSLS